MNIERKIKSIYYYGFENVEGELLICDDSIIFIAEKYGIITMEIKIKYVDMDFINRTESNLLIQNGIVIYTKEGLKHKFVLDNSLEILALLLTKQQTNKEDK